jgi:hypothetical protein
VPAQTPVSFEKKASYLSQYRASLKDLLVFFIFKRDLPEVTTRTLELINYARVARVRVVRESFFYASFL